MSFAKLCCPWPYPTIPASALFCNILCSLLVAFSSPPSMASAHGVILSREVFTHATQLQHLQPPTRSDPPLQAPPHSYRRGSPTGSCGRHSGLGPVGAARPADPLCQIEER